METSTVRTPVALYARVSSERQDVDLSVAAQLRALRDFADRHGYVVAREYIDEAESGRVADRPQFRKMLDEASEANAPFQEILVWKFSRFTRKREHAVAFKSMLRRRGIRVTSITEHADDSPTGRLMEAIIESVDEFYSENLAQEVRRGMREAASRGFFMAPVAPFGYRRVKVQDGAKERPKLEIDGAAAPVVKEIFDKALRGHGLKDICRDLNERGITNRGRRWQRASLHKLLVNEAYTGTAVWGKTNRGKKASDPVRVEGAWPGIVSRELFDAVGQAMRERAPAMRPPARVGSKFLLSGLLRCGACGSPFSIQSARSSKFAYYVCSKLMREGAGACESRYLNAPRVEGLVVDKIKERILTDETITELVTLVAEEVDQVAGELGGKLEAIEGELADVRKRLSRLYEALETSDLTMEVLSPRIYSIRHREEQLMAAQEDLSRQLEKRRVDLPSTEEIKAYVADFREFLQQGTFPERKALIRNFVEGIEVVGDQATLTYTIPMPSDGATKEETSVLYFANSGLPNGTILRTPSDCSTLAAPALVRGGSLVAGTSGTHQRLADRDSLRLRPAGMTV
ncbi:MAG: recombinase family protein [Chloroflexi bacterium]|nr:recombinase family protein [Chloroflexota bacterium]